MGIEGNESPCIKISAILTHEGLYAHWSDLYDRILPSITKYLLDDIPFLDALSFIRNGYDEHETTAK